jgi:hypothetical protein
MNLFTLYLKKIITGILPLIIIHIADTRDGIKEKEREIEKERKEYYLILKFFKDDGTGR